MRLLVIGGTSFVGRHTVEAALAGGHDVTVFNRGRTNPDLLAGQIESRRGDRRTGDYASLATDETWDAVVDVSAYVPRHVHELADVLADRTGHYVHVSSISAYDPDGATTDEDSPLHPDLTAMTEEITDQTYGPLKAMCERAATARFGASATAIVRPTYVCGPHDHSDRFTYWARRMAAGGDVVVMASAVPLQIVDARDLGAFIAHCAVTATAGAFDGVGPWGSVHDVLTELVPVGVTTRLVDVDGPTLRAAGIELPMVSDDLAEAPLSSRPGAAARAAGLVTRTAAETADATRSWDAERGRPPLTAGPTAEQEAAVLTGR